MKTKNDRLRPLLDEVLTVDTAPVGPDCTTVLGMVREERVRRAQRRVLAGAAVVVMGLVAYASFYLNPSIPTPVEVVRAVPEKPALPPVQRINDDELLALLNDSGNPSALMEWPNGERTLLIVEHGRQQPEQ
jgi:hypothetical protein